MHNESFNEYLAKLNVLCKINLSQGLWQGSQYERLIGLIEQVFYKSISNGFLTSEELGEINWDVEIPLNPRLLRYIEDDNQLPLRTPNAIQFELPNIIPEHEDHQIKNSYAEQGIYDAARKCYENGGR